MPNLKQIDSIKFTGYLNVNFSCEISQDDRIFLITDTGIYIIAAKSNLNSTFSQYCHEKYFIKPSTYTVSENFADIDINSFLYDLPKDVLYESVYSVELSQNLNGATPTTPSVLSAEWSPPGMVDKSFSMLAVLTNLYSLELYVKTLNECGLKQYKMVLNLTASILENRKTEFVYSVKMPPLQKMREIKKRIEYINPLKFTWSHKINEEFCVIFIGHFHGNLSVWKIPIINSSDACVNKIPSATLLCRYQSKLTNISALYWHKTAELNGILCAGDTDGKLSIFKVDFESNHHQCVINNETAFYTQKDRKIDKIIVISYNAMITFLVAIKQTCLLIYGIDSDGKVFDSVIHNVKNHYISGITYSNSSIKILTFTGQFLKLYLTIVSDKIIINENVIPVKYEISGFRTHGFIESKNQILYGILSSPYYLKNSFRGKKFINFSLFNNTNLNPLKCLMDNETDSLRTYWDCFEALRLICLKEQRFPWLGLDSNIDIDNLPLVKLKTLCFIAKISETVFCNIKRIISYDIKPYILLYYLVEIKLIMNRLKKLLPDIKKLSNFQMKSMKLQIFHLKELLVNGILAKAEVGECFVKELTEILAVVNEIEFDNNDEINNNNCCNICGENLLGATCLPPHSDSRCIFTFMPLGVFPAYICSLCGALAHKAVEKLLESILCPFCDYPMEKIVYENCSIHQQEELIEENRSLCVEDCLQEVVFKDHLYEELEDNVIDFLDISDEDECNDGQEIRDLYFKIGDLTIN